MRATRMWLTELGPVRHAEAWSPKGKSCEKNHRRASGRTGKSDVSICSREGFVASRGRAARVGPATVAPTGSTRLGKIRRWLRKLTGGEQTFREAGFVYDEGIRTVNAPARLEGYFQSERYFEDAAEAIRAGFTPPAEESGRLDALAARLLPPGPKLSLHIRRGDYTNPATMAFHGLMGPDYYARARRLIAERTGPSAVCVFTDDPEWVRANLELPADSVFVSEHTRSAVEDLILMSRCSHHITANSSFSWWGAWLNPKPDKVVVTPACWFQPAAGLDTSDLRPAGWLQA